MGDLRFQTAFFIPKAKSPIPNLKSSAAEKLACHTARETGCRQSHKLYYSAVRENILLGSHLFSLRIVRSHAASFAIYSNLWISLVSLW